MNLRFHNLTANAGAPVVVIVIFGAVEGMHMLICGTQLVAAFGAQLCFPLFSGFVGRVGYNIRYPCTCGTSAPMAGFVCVIDIFVCSGDLTTVTAAAANFITFRVETVLMNGFLATAAGTILPVCGFVVGVQTLQLMTGFLHITANLTGAGAAVGEIVFAVLDATATIGAAGPVIDGIMFPVLAYSVLGGCLLAAGFANLLVLALINVGEAAVFVFAGGINFLGRFSVTDTAGDLPATAVNTGSYLDHISGFPLMGFCNLFTAFGTDLAVLSVAGILPGTVSMIAVGLNTGLAAVACFLVAGVGFLVALGADLILFVGMIGLYLGGVVVITAGITGAGRTLVIGGAEIEVADLSLADHNTGTVITGSTGVTFDGVKIGAFRVVNQSNMGKTLFEEQIALLRGVVLTVLIRQAEIVGVGHCGSLKNTGGNTCFLCAPADKHRTPGGIGQAVPNAVFGVVVGTFAITDLGKCNTDNIVFHVAGVFVCIFVCCICLGREERQHQRHN